MSRVPMIRKAGVLLLLAVGMPLASWAAEGDVVELFSGKDFSAGNCLFQTLPRT
ncbi:MAG TPA: hypothetical protein PLO53_09145 [Candidatus Hydrogenedentes bacterium]|nr:hypothetical protein [Candidatus Hydrogenedentota bacterium]